VEKFLKKLLLSEHAILFLLPLFLSTDLRPALKIQSLLIVITSMDLNKGIQFEIRVVARSEGKDEISLVILRWHFGQFADSIPQDSVWDGRVIGEFCAS